MITIKQVIDGFIRFYHVNECDFIPINSQEYMKFSSHLIKIFETNNQIKPDLLRLENVIDDQSQVDGFSLKFIQKPVYSERDTNRNILGVLKTSSKSLNDYDDEFHSYKFFYEGDSLSIIANGVIIDLIK